MEYQFSERVKSLKPCLLYTSKAVKVRAVHAGELGLAAHGQAAAAAHARAVNHNGVHAHHGFEVDFDEAMALSLIHILSASSFF